MRLASTCCQTWFRLVCGDGEVVGGGETTGCDELEGEGEEEAGETVGCDVVCCFIVPFSSGFGFTLLSEIGG